MLSYKVVAERIKHEIDSSEGKLSYKDFAVIYRSKRVINVLNAAFRDLKIPVKYLGGDSSFESLEAKIMQDMLIIIDSKTFDNDPLLHWADLFTNLDVTPTAAERITETYRFNIENHLKETPSLAHGNAFIELSRNVMRDSIAVSKVNDDKKGHLAAVVSFLQTQRIQPKVTVRTLMENDGFQNIWYNALAQDAKKRLSRQAKSEGNISPAQIQSRTQQEVEQRTRDVESLFGNYMDYPISKTLADLRLKDMADDKDDPNSVTLTTAHSSKGLEWPKVFIVEVNKDSWPSKKSISEAAKLSTEHLEAVTDEELRLLFVSMTRAMDDLYLMMSALTDKDQLAEVSPFLPTDIKQVFYENVEKLKSSEKLTLSTRVRTT
ncbi:MAG: ATP-dependent helicase [Pedobacter sp.]|nr:MAG: ATP-dependent helicase [Pedobacter sp.]